MKNLILTLSLILGLGTSVSANNPFAAHFEVGDVFLCQSITFLSWEWEKQEVVRYRPETFKFIIKDDNTIKFGEGGFFNDIEMEISFMEWIGLKASKGVNAVSLDDKNFSFSYSSFFEATMMAASCERF